MDGLGLITLKSFGINNFKKKINEVIPEGSEKTDKSEKTYDVAVLENNIEGTYSTDLDLIELDLNVIKLIDKKKRHELAKWEKIKKDESYKVTKRQSKIDRVSSLELIKNSDKILAIHISDQYKKEYISRVSPIINEYRNLGTIRTYHSFNNNVNIEESIDRKRYRLGLIEDFLNIASKYININISKKDISTGCSSCGYDISKLEEHETDSFTCPNCYVEIVKMVGVVSSSQETGKKVSTGDSKINFVKDLNRFQGKFKNTKVPPNLIELLDIYFTEHNFPIGTEIKSSPELLKKTSKELMYKALKTVGMSKFYKDVNLICNLYWDWELINLDDLETKILERYDIINEVFEKMKDDRSSALNTQYELWWILTDLGYPCDAKEFKVPKTEEIFNYHEKKRHEICDQLGWNFTSLSIHCL